MRKILLMLFVLAFCFNANATHIMGGEITWKCIKDPLDPNVGKYVFTMKLYRDCDGVTLNTGIENIEVWENGINIQNIDCGFVSNTDISPLCDVFNSGNPQLDCYGPTPAGAVEEYLYQSLPVTLVGTPPASGWHFTWNSCCRNGAITNLILSSTTSPSEGFTLRAAMYPYTDPAGVVLPADPCFDSSPLFNESPKTIICSGYPFAYSHNASDPELDSIRYYWAEPLDDFFGTYDPDPLNGSPGSIPFVTGFTFNSPLPGNPALNPVSGEISYSTSAANAGNYATVTRVEAFKCGQKIAEIHRDIQAVLIACPSMPAGAPNDPPQVPVPVGAQIWTIDPMGSSLLPSYETTVTAGELVTFSIIGLDSNLYNGITPQDLTMEISGGQILDPFTGTCSNPPCASFNSIAGMPPPIISPGIVEGVFEWQTSCDHVSSDIACGRTTNLYQFSVKVVDDFCPAPAIRNVTLMIYVEADNQLSISEIQPSCFGNDGVITLSPSLSITQVGWDAELFDLSGNLVSGSYNILSNTYSLLNLSNGEYVVRASGAGGCIVEDSIVLLEAPNPLLVDYNVSHVSCYAGSDGEIGVDLSNGLSPYTFYINGVENMISPPYDSLFTNLSEGVYVITSVDSDSCGVRDTIYIDAPPFPLQVLSSNSITICDTSSEGSAVAYAAGGSPYPDGSYNFEWFTDSWGSLGVGDSIDNLGVGNYYLEVTDSNFCQSNIPFNVSTAELPLFISPQLFSVVCTGDSSGSAVVFSGGGTAPYDYEWSILSGSVLSTSVGVTDRDTLFDLLAGSYHLSITDASGCMDEMTFTIDEAPVRLEISDVLVVDSIDCYGSLDGRAIVYTLNGSGSPAYSYLWDNGETTALANSLSGGWHTVEVSDTRGCLVVDSVFIPENDIIKSDLSIIVPVSCYGYSDGEIGVNTIGGIPFVASPGYEYFWSNGVQPNFDFIDNLSHGSYYLTTRDALGCVVVDSIYLPEPDPLYVNAQEILRVSCYEDSTGTAYAVGMGGTIPYTFTWQNNNIISSLSNDSNIVYTLFAGLDTVFLEDSRGCTASDTVLIHQPDELVVSISDSIFAYCIGVNTASATASVIGGTFPYTYEWDDNNVVPQTTITASDLDAGIYMVTVQDSRGCLDSINVVLDSVTSVMEVNISSLSVGGNSVSCYGSDDGGLTVEVFSGTPPYTYQWVGPTGVSSNDTIFNLTSGNYSVTVTDVNGCVVNTNKVLTEPDPLLYKVVSTTASACLGSCDGVVQLYIEGGVSPYTAHLLNYNTSLTSSYIVDSIYYVFDICTGDYTVTIEDAHNCDAILIPGGSDQVHLDTTITTDVAVSQQYISCYGDSTGVISITNPQIGTLYSYLWENLNGDTIGVTTTVDSLPAGDYILYSSYSNIDGCTTIDTVTVLQNSLINSAVTLINVSCNGGSDGAIETTTFGGVSPYTYSWAPQNGTTSNLTSLSAGTYNLSIEDSNGCDVIESYQVGDPSELDVNVTISQGYVLTANATGGTPPYSYSWEEQSTANALGTQQTYTVVSNGMYYVVVTDANGCVETSGGTDFNETTGLINTVGGIALNIYPNPFKDETTVDFGREIKEATITIVDVYGKLVEIYNVANQQTHIIKRNNKASGVYFLEIEMEGQNINSKIILK